MNNHQQTPRKHHQIRDISLAHLSQDSTQMDQWDHPHFQLTIGHISQPLACGDRPSAPPLKLSLCLHGKVISTSAMLIPFSAPSVQLPAHVGAQVKGSADGVMSLRHAAFCLWESFLLSPRRKSVLWILLQIEVWWIWTCPCTNWQASFSVVKHCILQSWFESFQELLHIHQLPELMSPSTHTKDFSGFFFPPRFFLHRYPVDFVPQREDNYKWLRARTLTRLCMPTSLFSPSALSLSSMPTQKNSLFSERLKPAHQLWHTAWLQ